MSVLPSARIFSQYSGSRRVWLVITGILTCFLISSAVYVFQPWG